MTGSNGTRPTDLINTTRGINYLFYENLKLTNLYLGTTLHIVVLNFLTHPLLISNNTLALNTFVLE